LTAGDTVPVSIRQGRIVDVDGQITGWGVDIDGDFRVVNMSIGEDDALRLLLNRRDQT
jgi:hypothetical protein